MNIRHVFITGGTGSFGKAMSRRLLENPKISQITIFSRDEKKQHDMRQEFSSPKFRFIVGDIRDKVALERAMEGVDAVFHAAALKQVPTGEFFPLEMVKTNILGTHNVFESAKKNNVKKVVLLSTDKAVYPVNAMGMTKAMAEKVLIAESTNNSSTIFCGVRYGNVMGSRGSVIPLFIDLIKEGKSLKVTDSSMTRFLLSLDDAIDLVEFAIQFGEQGDIFIRKAPAASMATLSRAMLNLFKAKNKVEIIGIREGEKIHETLATSLELMKAQDMGNFYRIRNTLDHDYRRFFEKGSRQKIKNDYTSKNTKQLSVKDTEKLLKGLDIIRTSLESKEL